MYDRRLIFGEYLSFHFALWRVFCWKGEKKRDTKVTLSTLMGPTRRQCARFWATIRQAAEKLRFELALRFPQRDAAQVK